MELFSAILQFEDVKGEIIEVRKPSIMATEEMKARYDDLLKMLSEDGIKDKPFQDVYIQIKKVRKVINSIFKLVNVDPTQLNMDTMFQLLFPHQAYTEEGKEVYVFGGELINFVFGVQIPGEEPRVAMEKETIDYIAQTLGGLWANTEDFTEACVVLNTLSYKDLDSVMSARNEAMMSKEDLAKKKQKDAAEKLRQKLRKESEQKQKSGKVQKELQKPVEFTELSPDEIKKFM